MYNRLTMPGSVVSKANGACSRESPMHPLLALLQVKPDEMVSLRTHPVERVGRRGPDMSSQCDVMDVSR